MSRLLKYASIIEDIVKRNKKSISMFQLQSCTLFSVLVIAIWGSQNGFRANTKKNATNENSTMQKVLIINIASNAFIAK